MVHAYIIHSNKYAFIDAYIRAHACTHKYILEHMTHTYIHLYKRTHLHTYTHNKTYVQIDVKNLRTYRTYISKRAFDTSVGIRINVHTTCKYMHTYTY